MSKIITLDNFRKGFVCQRSGVTFPSVYRNIGYYYTQSVTGASIQSTQLAPTLYGLEKNEKTGLSGVTSERIRCLHPNYDSGRLWIRHHQTEQSAEGYLDALMDSMDHSEPSVTPDYTVHSVYQTRQGIYTLQHVPNRPGQGEDCLIIYAVKVKSRIGLMDHYTVVQSNGSIAKNPDDVLWRENM